MDDASDAFADRALTRLDLPAGLDAASMAKLRRLAIASDFALDVLQRQPDLLARLLADDGAEATSPPALDADNGADWPALLRRWRVAESTRLIWRDVNGLDEDEGQCARGTGTRQGCSAHGECRSGRA